MEPVSPNHPLRTSLRTRPDGRRSGRHALALLSAVLLAACTHTPSTPTAREKTMSEMTSVELTQRVIRLILSIHGRQDITPARVEKEIGVAVEIDANDPQEFGIAGTLADGGTYSLDSISDGNGKPARELALEFEPASNATQCAQPIGPYRQALVEGGFSAKWIGPPRLGSSPWWQFERGDVVAWVYVDKDAHQDDSQACISTIGILIAP